MSVCVAVFPPVQFNFIYITVARRCSKVKNKHLATVRRKNSFFSGRNLWQKQDQRGAAICSTQKPIWSFWECQKRNKQLIRAEPPHCFVLFFCLIIFFILAIYQYRGYVLLGVLILHSLSTRWHCATFSLAAHFWNTKNTTSCWCEQSRKFFFCAMVAIFKCISIGIIKTNKISKF